MTTTKTPAAATLATAQIVEIEPVPTAKASLVTLDQLAQDMKLPPRDARLLLRLAAKQTKQYPNLGKEHIARQPWQWVRDSKALDEARKALSITSHS